MPHEFERQCHKIADGSYLKHVLRAISHTNPKFMQSNQEVDMLSNPPVSKNFQKSCYYLPSAYQAAGVLHLGKIDQ